MHTRAQSSTHVCAREHSHVYVSVHTQSELQAGKGQSQLNSPWSLMEQAGPGTPGASHSPPQADSWTTSHDVSN